MINVYKAFSVLAISYLTPVANLWARIYIGLVFFRSGQGKLIDFEETIEFFADDWALPFLSPVPAAYLATAGELILPVLLILGLFTRVGALGLLVMAAVIQFFVMPLNEHYYWMIIMALLVGQGGSKLSLDHLLLKLK
ncbi:MAG: DoxX family protein [Arenicella sp.]|jgi:putative oxidoreductase|nr:DoxX family protein [Arenicella sp.]